MVNNGFISMTITKGVVGCPGVPACECVSMEDMASDSLLTYLIIVVLQYAWADVASSFPNLLLYTVGLSVDVHQIPPI